MKETKPAEIREMSIAELRDRIDQTRTALANMKINHVISPLEDTSVIKKTRKDLARMLTILAEKEKQN